MVVKLLHFLSPLISSSLFAVWCPSFFAVLVPIGFMYLLVEEKNQSLELPGEFGVCETLPIATLFPKFKLRSEYFLIS